MDIVFDQEICFGFENPALREVEKILNEDVFSTRGIKFPRRREVVNWLQENRIIFKFDYIFKAVRRIRFTTEEHKALFLLTWCS